MRPFPSPNIMSASLLSISAQLLIATTSVYPFIDSNQYFSSQAFKGQVVLVTGASRGIGREVALYYAKAGASLVLVSRKQETLDETRAAILKEVPGAEVLTFPADVKDPVKAEEAVKVATSRFGRLDVLIANAAAVSAFDKRRRADAPRLITV
jgi:NAD(P)-dependent dehydrogenase (short-subunit alcohol dehydrogenase family)